MIIRILLLSILLTVLFFILSATMCYFLKDCEAVL